MTSSASFAVWATYTRALARWTAAWSKPPALRWAGRSMSVCRCSTMVGPLHVMPINPDQALRTGGWPSSPPRNADREGGAVDLRLVLDERPVVIAVQIIDETGVHGIRPW